MTSIPLFESLQNEMHRRMGCSHLGCFNEAASAKIENARSSSSPLTAPSTWRGGLYGYICEGKGIIDDPIIYTLAESMRDTRRRSSRPASEKGKAQLNIDDIRANTTYGGNVGEAMRFGDEIQRYFDMSDKEKKILEQEATAAFHFHPEEVGRFLDIVSRLKSGEFGDPTGRSPASRLISKMGRALRTGSDGFYDRGDGSFSFPKKLWEDPLNYEWEEVEDQGSGSFTDYTHLGESRRE